MTNRALRSKLCPIMTKKKTNQTQLKLIETLTNIREEQEGKQIAVLIRQINEMGRKNKARKAVLEPEPQPPLAA